MSPTRQAVDRLEDQLGDVLERHDEAADLSKYEQYEEDPVAFVREVIGDEPWRRQRDVMRAVVENRKVSVRSANATGKSKVAAWLSLWWALARQGKTVITLPTETQGVEIVMRGEVWPAFSKGNLPGEMYTNAYRPRGGGPAGVLLKTATGASSLTGFHDDRVLFIIDEAQDFERLDPHAWEAADAVATGEYDRKVAFGNPLNPTGRFYRTHQPDSDWRAIKIPASDVPNVREGETVVPGLLTREAIEDIAADYGRDSGFYRARIEAEFPQESERGLVRREWLDEAAKRHERGNLLYEASDAREQRILAVDVARHGPDATVVAIRRGDVIEGFESWHGADTEETADRVWDFISDMGAVSPFTDKPMVRRVWVDASGLGAGVYDKLKKRRPRRPGGPYIREYKGARSPKDDDRYRRLRDEAFWKLRDRLEEGEIALPDDEELFQELLAIRYRLDGQGRVSLERKKDLRKRLRRSPDKADAVAMAFHRDGRGGVSAERMTVKWG